MEEIMKKRQKEADDAYEAQWDGGRGAHHPDYDPEAIGDGIVKANRATEELYNAIVKNDVRKVYEKIDEGADVAFVFGKAYQSQGARLSSAACVVSVRRREYPNLNRREAASLSSAFAFSGGPCRLAHQYLFARFCRRTRLYLSHRIAQ
jgi:hypothetical protein